jgi:hypothetical protein
MNKTFRTVTIFLAISMPIANGVNCIAQGRKVSPEQILDAAMQLKRAVESADRIEPDGVKYCKWQGQTLKSSDLSDTISRFLLSHSSQVPESIPASKMWRVSFMADDIMHQLYVGESQCSMQIRYTSEARSTHRALLARIEETANATVQFKTLAYRQTKWMEQTKVGSPSDLLTEQDRDTSLGMPHISADELLVALHELRDATDIAQSVTAKAEATDGCMHFGGAPDSNPSYVVKLIDYLVQAPQGKTHIPASNIWSVARDGDTEQLGISLTMSACLPFIVEKKKARKPADEAFDAYVRLSKANAQVKILALRQTEWEEQTSVLEQ